jgi:hypothetical protein
MVTLSDRQITTEVIRSCCLGDRDAFRALYDTYKDRVYGSTGLRSLKQALEILASKRLEMRRCATSSTSLAFGTR